MAAAAARHPAVTFTNYLIRLHTLVSTVIGLIQMLATSFVIVII